MDSTSLRLTLILIGLVILALIWFLHKPDGRGRSPGATRRDGQKRQEPALDPANEPSTVETGDRSGHDSDDGPPGEPRQTQLPDLGSEAPDWSIDSPRRTDARRTRVAPEAAPKTTAKAEPRLEPTIETARGPDSGDGKRVEPRWPGDEPEPDSGSDADAPRVRTAPSAGGEPPKVVTLYLRARGERLISGLTLLDSAIKAGLRFGEMKIFHRRHQGASKPVFSMANITRPGSFDPSGWNLFETPGVTLFMTLPGPVSALDAWDAMLATGQRLSELLEADLMDDSQCLLTRQRISQIREDMREFDRKAGLGG
ncbi:cell division protein ZipA [Wenzhouxiangella sp. XN79A]|uniref:cell division protein ZipA n=1 Tax=Wenzhouxiangella sp. XN79A TaxID=2724193 RepID=UPI00144A8DE6|nr:cell division protein ZipA [Wenzhouxiangella sp. XN79A]NKI36267.1 cell division protein ZipA [Wenzhouxiangella sp. XN79A]